MKQPFVFCLQRLQPLLFYACMHCEPTSGLSVASLLWLLTRKSADRPANLRTLYRCQCIICGLLLLCLLLYTASLVMLSLTLSLALLLCQHNQQQRPHGVYLLISFLAICGYQQQWPSVGFLLFWLYCTEHLVYLAQVHKKLQTFAREIDK